MKTLLAFAVSLPLLTACGQKSSRENVVAKPVLANQAKPLAGLPTAELLATKYDSLLLTCEVSVPVETFDHGTGQVAENHATTRFDLLKDSSVPQTAEVAIEDASSGIATNVHFLLEKIHVDSLVTYQDTDGNRYELQFSPVVEGRIAYSRSLAQGKFASLGGAAQGDSLLQAFEGVAGQGLQSEAEQKSADDQLRLKVGTHVLCHLDGKIKPAYQSQFKKGK